VRSHHVHFFADAGEFVPYEGAVDCPADGTEKGARDRLYEYYVKRMRSRLTSSGARRAVEEFAASVGASFTVTPNTQAVFRKT
jgi:hypothetical protein